MVRTSPSRHKRRLRSPKPYSKPWNKSPLKRKRNSGEITRHSAAPRLSHRSARISRTRIVEPVRQSPLQRRLRTFHNNYHGSDLDEEDTYFDDSNPSDEEQEKTPDDESFFHWEEESTLLSDLMEDASDEDRDEELDNLADSLQKSFDLCGRELKREIAETFVPTVNHVKALYRVLEEKVDVSFGKGIILFNNACKEAEAMAIQEQDDLAHAYATTQRNVENLLSQLKEAYASRDRLWAEFEKSLNAIAEPTLESLRHLPGKIEHTIGNLERHAKLLNKNDNDITEKKIKGVLSKIS